MRKVIPFNDGWLFAKPGQEPEPVTLPHTWNALYLRHRYRGDRLLRHY